MKEGGGSPIIEYPWDMSIAMFNDHGPLRFNQYGNTTWCYGNCGDTITDIRDGQKYATTCIGEQIWMAENLNYAGAGLCFNNDPAYCETKGRLYSIFELINRQVSSDSNNVQGLCPSGWHVPSKEEFLELINYCGGENNAVIKLRSKDWPFGPKPTDEYGFNLLPSESAFYDPSSETIKFISNSSFPSTYLWTSTGTIRSTGNDSYQLFETRSTITMGLIGTQQSQGAENYYHCRCVKD